jgi:hypothetical protein
MNGDAMPMSIAHGNMLCAGQCAGQQWTSLSDTILESCSQPTRFEGAGVKSTVGNQPA